MASMSALQDGFVEAVGRGEGDSEVHSLLARLAALVETDRCAALPSHVVPCPLHAYIPHLYSPPHASTLLHVLGGPWPMQEHDTHSRYLWPVSPLPVRFVGTERWRCAR